MYASEVPVWAGPYLLRRLRLRITCSLGTVREWLDMFGNEQFVRTRRARRFDYDATRLTATRMGKRGTSPQVSLARKGAVQQPDGCCTLTC